MKDLPSALEALAGAGPIGMTNGAYMRGVKQNKINLFQSKYCACQELVHVFSRLTDWKGFEQNVRLPTGKIVESVHTINHPRNGSVDTRSCVGQNHSSLFQSLQHTGTAQYDLSFAKLHHSQFAQVDQQDRPVHASAWVRLWGKNSIDSWRSWCKRQSLRVRRSILRTRISSRNDLGTVRSLTHVSWACCRFVAILASRPAPGGAALLSCRSTEREQSQPLRDGCFGVHINLKHVKCAFLEQESDEATSMRVAHNPELGILVVGAIFGDSFVSMASLTHDLAESLSRARPLSL